MTARNPNRPSKMGLIGPNNRIWTTLAGLLIALLAIALVGGCSKSNNSTNDNAGAGGGGNTAFQVVSISPTDAATGVSVNAKVIATFNKDVDPASVTATSFVVNGASGTRTVDKNTVTFTPTGSYGSGQSYTVQLTTAITSSSGDALQSSFDVSFTTAVVPVADAGPDMNVSIGESFMLDGSASSDPGGGTLTYSWTPVSGPSTGSQTGVSPSVTAPGEVGTVVYELVVSNGTESSAPDRVNIRVFEDKDHAYFVSTSGDDTNAGTMAAPFATLYAATKYAASDGSDVYVAEGTYSETVSLVSGVSLYGGFEATNWTRDPAAHTTTINGSATAVYGNGASDLTIDGFTIMAADATSPSQSSIGIGLNACTNLYVTNNTIHTGNGMPGSNGGTGTSYTSSASGGKDGANAYFALTCGKAGGSGGGSSIGRAGGYGGYSGGAGGGGAGGAGQNGGGAGGSSVGLGKNGNDGKPGAPGGIGGTGSFGPAFGTAASGFYYAANGGTGKQGAHGYGGGGGSGGGAGVACSGSGGGGGAGGHGGNPGYGGNGGGGSFGIILTDGSAVTIKNNQITTGNGANGGYGGKGGKGQGGGSRGYGGDGNANGGAGGDGGVGGAGGYGGYGGSGGGGPVIGIVEAGSSSTRDGNVFTLGDPGAGGVRPDGEGNVGEDGEKGEYKKIS